MSFLQRLEHESDDESINDAEHEHRTVIPKKQFKKSLASRGRQEFQVLKQDARKRELQILARNYVHQLAQSLQTRISTLAFKDTALLRECITVFCGGEEDSNGIDVEVRRELLGDVEEYAAFLKEQLLAERDSRARNSATHAYDSDEEEEGNLEYFKVGADHHRQTFIVNAENLEKRLAVAPNAEYLMMLHEEYKTMHHLKPLEIIEKVQRFCITRWDPKLFLQFAKILKEELSALLETGLKCDRDFDGERMLKMMENFLSIYMMQYVRIEHGESELAVQIAYIFTLYLRATDAYFKVHDHRFAVRRNRRMINRAKQGQSSNAKKVSALMRERPTKETLGAQFDRLFESQRNQLSLNMLCLCKWLEKLELVSLPQNSDKDTAMPSDSDSDSDSDSESESESDSDKEDDSTEDILTEQARYVTELFSEMCKGVLTRAQEQLNFDSIVDYLRFLLLTEEYNERFGSKHGYFDNSSTTKMPLELAKDASIGPRAERIAAMLTRSRSLLTKTLAKYEQQEMENTADNRISHAHLRNDGDSDSSDEGDSDDEELFGRGKTF